MNYKVLYRKYRPNNFENLIGQDYTKKMLTNIIASGKIGHAYIFTGPRGTGKTSSAKLFAKAINCLNPINGSPCGECENCNNFNESPDIIEIDAASNNGVDEIRELIENVKLSPSSMNYKVYIIDEVHMLSQSAFNALLLTLEEPPSHVVFILATTDIQNVPITILSRCQRFDFRPIDTKHIVSRLKYVANEENINITDEALLEIAFISSGGMRDALSILDQLAADNELIDINTVISNFGTISTERIKSFVQMFVNNKVSDVIEFLQDVKDKGVYYSVFLEKLILELRNFAIDIKLGKEAFDYNEIYQMILDLNICLSGLNVNIDPYTLIEITVLKHMHSSNIEIIEKTSNDEIKDDSKTLINNNEAKSNSQVVTDQNISREIKSVNNLNMELSTDDDKNISREINKSIKSLSDNHIKIRVNNCFAQANKNSKAKISNYWSEFLSYLGVNDMYLMSLLADSKIMAASDNYVIISNSNLSTNALINNSISDIERLFTNLYNINCKFVSLTTEEWEKNKAEYISNTKNGIKYSIIDEDLSEAVMEENDELEKLAIEIFGTSSLEIE